ncbi:unnamed protein product [Trypanosoma congolense IL3000]|uniref:WGS project CAEQ00000000 data, annotated contig 882 n=1 Tax=Trypanosoma congolense (strain IL3000) TaxID=1068625 RepID=F9WJ80_TRYCI|nr:unnamed protein product [Trypanosoma congolense IL3000]
MDGGRPSKRAGRNSKFGPPLEVFFAIFPMCVFVYETERGRLYIPRGGRRLCSSGVNAFILSFVKGKKCKSRHREILKSVTEVTPPPLQMGAFRLQAFCKGVCNTFERWGCFAAVADWEIIYTHSSVSAHTLYYRGVWERSARRVLRRVSN